MEFRLLGPLDVGRRDEAIPLGGHKQRTVLAHLLLQANRLVTADRLIGQLWDDDPPQAARNVLQTYVSRLRKALGPERLEARQGGYVLHADPDEIDVARFTELLRSARAATPIDPVEAARCYRAAEALWRGTALEDLADQASLQGDIIHLDELRAAALDERIVVELALGRHSALVAELEAFTSDNPLRESLWAHLMTALYRSGRQADALAAYRRARAVLERELALDPSPELQRLEHRVLEQDPSLDVAGVPIRGLRLLERIGQGSFGVVHRAIQPHVGRDVAVKVVRPRFANDPDFIRRFEAEAQTIARLEHPRIVPLYDYWRDPTGTFLVMRLLRGGSLREVLARGPLPVHEVLGVVEHVGAALATAHRHGVIHRDVKPANILFDEEGNAYLSDFGIAMDVSTVRDVKTSPTPDSSAHYLSPEELRGEPPTIRTDVFSLGLVLFEMLAGRLPWADPGAGPLASPSAVLPELSRLRGNLPPAVDAVLRRATTADPDERHHDVTALVESFAEALHETPVHVDLQLTTRNPYKGLRPFLEPDAPDFFGRQELVDRLVDRLAGSVGDAGGARLLALVGPSGSGKSSVVHAGLVPALRAGAVPGSERWLVADLTPGTDPFADLAAALLLLAAEPPPGGLFEALPQNGQALLETAEWLLPDEGAYLLLVVDQFEEVYTLTDEDTRTRFLTVLGEAADDPRGRVRVVLTLRADLLDRLLAHGGLAEHLRSGTELVVALKPGELERAITGPAEHAGVTVDQALVAQLVSDVHDQPGALPLLQFTLAELVDRGGSATLTTDLYAGLGGVAGAVASGAEEIYGSLPLAQQELARQLFLRLVHSGPAGTPTRRRALRKELASLAADPVEMEALIDAFVRRRMLSLDRDADTRQPTVELAHESLVRAWGRLGRWIVDVQEDLDVQRRLSGATDEWRAAGEDPSLLVVGSRLEQLESWRDRTDLAVTPEEDAFLRASVAQREAARAETSARAAHELALERRALRRFQHLVVVLVAGVLVAGGFAVFAFDQREQAERERTVAVTRELAAAAVANLDVDAERSLLLALEAVGGTRAVDAALPEAVEALHRALGASRITLRVPGLGGALDWSPDGTVFVTEGPEESGVVDIRDAATGERVRSFRGHDGDINLVAFSADGSRLATSGDDGVVRVWDVASGKRLHSFEGATGQVWGVSFSPDGSLLAASSWDEGVVRVWELAGGELVQEVGPLTLSLATSFSPDGRRLAVATFDTGATVVDVRTGRTLEMPGESGAGVLDVDYSPDGRWLAATGLDGSVRVVDAGGGRSGFELSGHRGEVVAADWSSDSTRLATGSADGSVKVWAVERDAGRELLSIPVQERGGGLWVAFSPDGRRVMTGDQGITAVKVFDVSESGDAEWANLATGTAATVAFTPDSERVVTSDGDGSLVVWSARSGRRTATIGRPLPSSDPWAVLGVSPDGVVAATASGAATLRNLDGSGTKVAVGSGSYADIAWNFDGSLLALAGNDGGLEVVDPAGELVTELDAAPGHALTSARFSPDSRLLAAASRTTFGVAPVDTEVTVWDWRERKVSRRLRAGGVVAFSPDGTRLAAAPEFGPVSVWDLRKGDEVARLVGHNGGATDVEFAPSGPLVATASTDGTVRLWDGHSGVERLVLRGHVSAVLDVAFSPDGSRLASVGADGVVRIWALDLRDLVTLARQSLTRKLTAQECVRYASACG